MDPEIRRVTYDGVGWGFLLGAICDVAVLAAIWFSEHLGVLSVFGLLQWLWLLPVWGIARKNRYPQIAKGVLLAGLIAFLLQAACYGLVILMLSGHR